MFPRFFPPALRLALVSAALFPTLLTARAEELAPARAVATPPAHAAKTPVPGLKDSALTTGSLQPSSTPAGMATGITPLDAWRKNFPPAGEKH